MIPSHLSPEFRRTLLESPTFKQLSSLTLVLAIAFFVVPFIMGGVLFVLKQQEIARPVADLQWLQTPALILCGIFTLGIIIIVPKIAGARVSTRLSTMDAPVVPNRSPNTADPQLVTIYVISLAVLEFPLLPMFVGTLVGGFEFQAYIIGSIAYLFGLAYIVFAVRPLILQSQLQTLARTQPQV